MSRKALGLIGILLIVVGAVSLIWGGITYTQHEDVIELGNVDVEAETEESIPLPPVLGVVALGGGILLLVASRK
jgi:hypothetical protein